MFSLEISVLGFPTSGKNPQKKFFSLRIFFREKKTVPCNDFPQTKWRLNSPAQEEQKIFEKKMVTKFFCARRTRKMTFELLSCARRIRKAETSLKPPSSIGLHWHDRQFECDSESETDLKFGLHIYDLNLPIEAKLFSRSSAI